MSMILSDELLEEFKKEFNVDSNNVIIKLDSKNKLASYIVNSTMYIVAEYEKVLKYYNR